MKEDRWIAVYTHLIPYQNDYTHRLCLRKLPAWPWLNLQQTFHLIPAPGMKSCLALPAFRCGPGGRCEAFSSASRATQRARQIEMGHWPMIGLSKAPRAGQWAQGHCGSSLLLTPQKSEEAQNPSLQEEWTAPHPWNTFNWSPYSKLQTPAWHGASQLQLPHYARLLAHTPLPPHEVLLPWPPLELTMHPERQGRGPVLFMSLFSESRIPPGKTRVQ